MAVYGINGGALDYVYDVAGAILQQAYDVAGNGLIDGPVVIPSLVVMSYNVQDFTGINAQQALQNAIVNTYDADIIGIQEFYKQDVVPDIAANMLASYAHLYRSTHKNFNAIASQKNLYSITIADYASQDPEDMSRYSETRCYIKGYFTWAGRQICFINTHLCYLTDSYKYAQMAELFALAQQEDYVIITGDFNFFALAADEPDYINMYKQFVDAGYKLADCTEQGFVKTYSNLTSAASLADFRSAADNIIVSSNINIDSVVFDTTKLSYLDGNVIDHIPVIATLSLT